MSQQARYMIVFFLGDASGNLWAAGWTLRNFIVNVIAFGLMSGLVAIIDWVASTWRVVRR